MSVCLLRMYTENVCACAIYKECGPSAQLELPPDDFSRNTPGTLWVAACTLFLKRAVQECSVYVHMVKFQSSLSRECNQGSQ